MKAVTVLLTIVLGATVCQAATIHVPGDRPSIQSGVNYTSEGDTVLVAPGYYQGSANRDIHTYPRSIWVVSEGGPRETTIDCEGLGRGFEINDGGHTIYLEGFTIKNGVGDNQGGALEIFDAVVHVSYCVFENNAADYGAVVYINGSPEVSFTNCTFYENVAGESGSISYRNYAGEISFTNCLTVGNYGNGSPLSGPHIYCCNVWGNVPGDFLGSGAQYEGVNGNFSGNPYFCPDHEIDYLIPFQSPCAPDYNSCQVLIGAIEPDCDIWEVDTDSDGVPDDGDSSGVVGDSPCDDGQTEDCDDNCPGVSNPEQYDIDDDGLGDVCENCPANWNPDQLDLDDDGIGDVCDSCMDFDGDGYGDPGYPQNTCALDNCLDLYNPDQNDPDMDSIGTACDNCPDHYNHLQEDLDNDGLGDSCDVWPNDPYNDYDGDGVAVEIDNCPRIYNPDQVDSNGDGAGDACNCCDMRADVNHNGIGPDIADLVVMVSHMFQSGPPPSCWSGGYYYPEADINGDGVGPDIADLVNLVGWMFCGPEPPPVPCPGER